MCTFFRAHVLLELDAERGTRSGAGSALSLYRALHDALGGQSGYVRQQIATAQYNMRLFDEAQQEFEELQAQAQGRLFRTSQGDFGAPSVKPTALWSNSELEACISNTGRGAALPQLTEDGRFGTGRSEEYPPLFCRAIVWDLVTAWDARSSAILAQQVSILLNKKLIGGFAPIKTVGKNF